MKRTYQPKNRQRKKEHGFRKRMSTAGGRKVLASRRRKGRKVISAQVVICDLLFYLGKGANNMLHKRFRLSKGQEYNNTYNRGLKIPGKYIVVYITPNNQLINRFGIVASKKIGNAVKRNRARRRIRAIVAFSQGKLRSGYNIVIIARQSIFKADFKLLENDYYTVMKKAGLC